MDFKNLESYIYMNINTYIFGKFTESKRTR